MQVTLDDVSYETNEICVIVCVIMQIHMRATDMLEGTANLFTNSNHA